MVIRASFAGVPEFGEVAVGMEFVSSGPEYQILAGGGEGGWFERLTAGGIAFGHVLGLAGAVL